MTFAHAGHWLVNLLYAVPLFVVVGAILRDRMRERREDAAAELEPDPGGRD
jgi:hypothetical protein